MTFRPEVCPWLADRLLFPCSSRRFDRSSRSLNNARTRPSLRVLRACIPFRIQTSSSASFLSNTAFCFSSADNISAFDQWKAYDQILANYKLYIYPRKTKTKLPDEFLNHPKVIWSDAPKIEISSSQIRKRIKEGKDVSSLIPEASYDYLMENNFYHS